MALKTDERQMLLGKPNSYLDGSTNLYKRDCPSVCLLVRPLVRPLVSWLVRRSVTSSVTSFFFYVHNEGFFSQKTSKSFGVRGALRI